MEKSIAQNDYIFVLRIRDFTLMSVILRNINMRTILFFVSLVFSTYSIASNVGLSGGLGGTAFEYPDNISMKSIKLCGGSLVDSIETTYTTSNWPFPETLKHGGNGGTCSTLDLASYALQKITGCFNGNTINSLTLIRSDGATVTKGECNGAAFSYGSTSSSQTITGFYGRSATLLDAIGVKITQTSGIGATGPSGSKGGNPFELSFANAFSLKICSANKVDSITVTNYNNTFTKVGGNGGSCQTIVLNGAAVYSISGQYTMDGIEFLIINTGVGSYVFGVGTGIANFNYESNYGLGGLIGRSGSRIDAIGAIF
jgi:hypothetical protein